MAILPLQVTDTDFEEEVLKAELPVVVDFWAPWCGPCKMVGPILDKFAGEFADSIKITKVNTDENQQYAMQFGVQGIPTMMFFYKGELVHRQVGALPEPVLKDLFNEFIRVTSEEQAQN